VTPREPGGGAKGAPGRAPRSGGTNERAETHLDPGLKDRNILLVGASRGIGLATARAFAPEGCRLALVARDEERLAAAVREVADLRAGTAGTPDGEAVIGLSGDATVEDDAGRIVREASRRLGDVDVLVNVVGGSQGDPGIAAPEADWDAALGANLRAAVRMTRLVAPAMRGRGSGAIVNVASIFGREWGGAASYNAAKAALIAYTKTCARDLAPHGVRVNAVAPGSILFPGGSWDRRRRSDPAAIEAFVARELPLGRFGRPDEVAAVIVFLASPRASLVIGACLNVDGGQSRSLF
jgi:3-oxoacyl-[acyl-carrier protein] reductase